PDRQYHVEIVYEKLERELPPGHPHRVFMRSEEEMRAELLADAYQAMHRFRAKYGILKELSPVFATMKKTMATSTSDKVPPKPTRPST
ncbi:MAG TPA: hypothetical protein VMT52_15270, partial [Planctomycetota bacterium]|nr:hypothetical protein [Planctomycetota bacterium]